jgi:hypothetical protein
VCLTLESAGAPLRSFGRQSYEIRLTHIFAMGCVLDTSATHGSPPGAVLPAHLLSLAFAWGLGWIAARAWSSPVAPWVQSASARRTGSATAEPASPRSLSS